MRYIVIGGGLAGLIAAWTLRENDPGSDIMVIERNADVGGLLAGIEYSDRGLYFDIGTHIFQETGEAEIDAALLGAIPKADLLHFPVGEGDRAGVVFAGRLQSNTHFPDLRGAMVEPEVFAALREHVEADGEIPEIGRIKPLLNTATDRFGKVFTDHVIAPTLARAYGRPADELAGFALLLPGWARIVLDEYADWSERIGDKRYRALVAVPDQRNLPPALHHGRRSFYSRRRGTRAFIDGLATSLRNNGVEVSCGAHITSIELNSRRVGFIDAKGCERTVISDGIVIATGVVGAAQLIGMDLAAKGLDRPMPHWVINVELEDPCTSDLCYLYGLDESCDWYRVTNYRAFSGDPNDRRLTIEVVGQHHVDSATWPARLTAQLRSVGLIESDTIQFADVHKLGAGFPAPTIRNMQALAGLGIELEAAMPDSVTLGGIGSRPGLFFQNEVVADIYRRVRHLA